ELARLACIAVGRMRGDLLVAHVDDADALVHAAVVDVDDVAAAQREDRVDTLVLERPGHQVAAGDHAGVAALALQSIVRCRALRLIRCGVYGCHGLSRVNPSGGAARRRLRRKSLVIAPVSSRAEPAPHGRPPSGTFRGTWRSAWRASASTRRAQAALRRC